MVVKDLVMVVEEDVMGNIFNTHIVSILAIPTIVVTLCLVWEGDLV